MRDGRTLPCTKEAREPWIEKSIGEVNLRARYVVASIVTIRERQVRQQVLAKGQLAKLLQELDRDDSYQEE